MRTLLELHYDAIHFQRWKEKNGKAPLRRSEYHVFNTTVNAHRKKMCQRLTLPKDVKSILQIPRDEENLHKLEELRKVILREIEGEEYFFVDNQGQAESIADAVVKCPRETFVDEVGVACCLPSGSRVLLDGEFSSKAEVAAAVRQIRNDWITVLMRPYETPRSPLVDEFGKNLRDKTIADLEAEWTRPQIMDRLLLCLFDALWLKQSDRWSKAGVANLNVDETPELAKWFLHGMNVGAKPIFDGICSMCGALLYGEINQRSANHNKTAGPPLDRDGSVLLHPDGSPRTDAQPPFLLRYSPQVFAKEAPAVFTHDPETNRLSLVEGMHPPWLRREHARSNKFEPWLYCVDCHDRYLNNGKRQRSHIPYRDKASQSLMKRMHERELVAQDSEVTSQAALEEPEAAAGGECDTEMSDHDLNLGDDDGSLHDDADAGGECDAEKFDHDVDCSDVDDVLDDDAGELLDGRDGQAGEEPLTVDVVDRPDTVYPTLEEYKVKWGRSLAQHSKPVSGVFSHSNLIPDAIPQLWQDCPHVPFDKLTSNDAVSRLSRCRPINGFTPAHVADGHVRYAHNTGEVNFRRRHPLQLASTMGFVLNKRAGNFPGLTQEEKYALHEILTWMGQPGNNPVCFYGSELEDYSKACKTLMDIVQPLLPEGSTRARIRATSRISKKNLQDGSLGDTLGDEARGLVVLDFEGHPQKYNQIEIFRDVVAKEVNVLKIDVPRHDGRGWKRTHSEIDTQDLGEEWPQQMSKGARYVLEETWVRANDPHYDAKCYPHMHPYGTGSVLSEYYAGGPKSNFRNRVTQIQSIFRRSPLWAFWKLDWSIKHDLFHLHKRKQEQRGLASSSQLEADPHKRLFGMAIPKNIPESSAWWKEQAKDLFALTEEHELGMMSAMVTITHNDLVPEMLANIRRGTKGCGRSSMGAAVMIQLRAIRTSDNLLNPRPRHFILHTHRRAVGQVRSHRQRRQSK